MLEISIPGCEYYDEAKGEFFTLRDVTLKLEHSLISLSKWESKWCKVFLSKEDKTYAETIDYIRCMTITPNVDPLVYERLTKENVDAINNYISAPMTATYINDSNKGSNREKITSELIYYWMIAQNIPFECEKWHLNRLLTLIRVCSIKNAPPKKMSKKDIMSRNAALNAARRKQLNSKG